MNTPRRLVSAAFALALALVLAPGLSAQEAAPAPGAAAQEAPRKKLRRHPDRISIEEIRAAEAAHPDAHEIVRALRPAWFRTRGVSSISRPVVVRVYVDGMQAGGLEALRRVDSNSIAEMEYLDGPSATQRFGTDHGAGAILVRIQGRG